MRLRTDVSIEDSVDRFGQQIVLVHDPVAHRSFALPRLAGSIARRLQGEVEVDELDDLARELDGTAGSEDIEAFVARLSELCLLDEALSAAEIQRLAREANREEQWQGLRSIVRFAAERVPCYRDKLAALGITGRLETPEDLAAIPLLTKEEIQANYPDGFIPDDTDLAVAMESREVMVGTSSGSSAGDRLRMVFSAETRALQMAAGAMLNRDVYAAFRAPQAVLTSMHCADPYVCVRETPDMEGRIRDGNRLLLLPPADPAIPTLDEVRQILGELVAYRAVYLDCNPSYLANVTYAAVDAGLALPRLGVITSGYEYLSELTRRFLAAAWGCPVYNRFTASELGNFQFLECEHGALHVHERYFYPEILRDGRPARPGELGSLVETTLQDPIPMIRYDTRDLFVAGDGSQCPCGGSRTIGEIAGRAADLTVAVDGSPRSVRDVDLALAAVAGLRTYQLVQPRLASYELKLVVEPGADGKAVQRCAAEAVAAVMGNGSAIRTIAAKHIYTETSGKFRRCRSEVPGANLLVRAGRPGGTA